MMAVVEVLHPVVVEVLVPVQAVVVVGGDGGRWRRWRRCGRWWWVAAMAAVRQRVRLLQFLLALMTNPYNSGFSNVSRLLWWCRSRLSTSSSAGNCVRNVSTKPASTSCTSTSDEADEAVAIDTCVLLATSTTRSHAGSGGILRYLGGSHLLLQSCRSSKLKPFAEQLNVKGLYQRLYTPALVS